MKKCMTLTVALLMLLQATASAAAVFKDTDGHWAESFICALTESGVVQGDGESFRPDESVNVDEFLKMTLSAMNAEVRQSQGNWAQPYIAEALKRELVYSDEFDSYNRPATRGEVVKIVTRAIDANSVPEAQRPSLIAKISDYYDIHNEYKEYVLAAYANRLINGFEDNSFRCGSPVTRAEASVIIGRMIQAGDFDTSTGNGDMINGVGNTIYVAAGGNGNGTLESPFGSIEQARDKVREIIAAGAYPEEGITVYLRGGDYEMDKSLVFGASDSGSDGKPVTYASYPGEVARLTGTKKLEYEAFDAISKDMADRLIDKSAANSVLQIDLKAQGIEDLGRLSRRGFLITADELVQPELYIDGSRMQLSRWPNREWVGTTEIVRSGARSQKGVLEGAVYKIDYDRPNRWKTNIGEIYTAGVLGPNYFYGYFPLEKIEPGQITLKEGSVTSYYSKHFIRYENVFEELDAPGEYYIDRTSGMLYLYQPQGFDSGTDISLSTLGENIISASGAKNITLKNLKIEGSRAGGIRATDADKFIVENCEISGTGTNGIYIKGTNCTVKNSVIHDIGATGISMNGGDYENAVSAGNVIANNHIYRAAQIERSYQAGITLGYQSVGTVVSHNELHDMPHAAMIIYGPNHTIEYNNIYDAVKEFHDMDAIYLNVYQYPWERNVVIRRNFIHDLGHQTFTEKQMNVAGIRSDNNGNGLQVLENVFYNIGYQNANGIRGVCAQGIDNVVENNLFIDTSGTYEGAHTYNPSAKWDITSDSVKPIYEQWLKYSPKYAEKNPEVASFFNHHFAAYENGNSFKNNVVVNIKFPLGLETGAPSAQGFYASEQLVDALGNIVTKSDPGFVDYRGGNFALKDDSEIYTKIEGFPKLDFENIGLLDGETVGVK